MPWRPSSSGWTTPPVAHDVRLNALIETLDLPLAAGADREIGGVRHDSRRVEPGDLFVSDGRAEAVMRQISTEAYETPEIFENAPHNGSVTQVDLSPLEQYEKTILSCKQYRKKKNA